MDAEAAREYVAATVLPAMGIPGRAFSIESPPDLGTRSTLHLVRAEGMPPLLLRSFPQRRPAAATVRAMRHVESLGLPGPRLVFHDVPPMSRRAGGPALFTTLETWIEGIPHVRLADPEAARAATLGVGDLLARLHAVTSPRWGPPGRRRLRSFTAHTWSVARRMARDLRGRGLLGASESERFLRACAAWWRRLERIRPFSLLHNDLNRHNVIMTSEGRIVPVDLHRLAYGAFPEEVINALYHFCRKDADLAEAFQETYFARAGDAARDLFAGTRRFFEPLHYLKKMHRRAAGPGASPGDAKMERWRGIVLSIAPPP